MPILTIDKFSGGIHASTITSQVQQDLTDCEDALNVEFHPRGTVSQRDGYRTAVVSTAPSGVIRMYMWKTGGTNFQLAYTCTSGTMSATMGTVDLEAGTYTIKLSSGAAWAAAYDDAIDITSYCNSAIATFGECIGAPISFNGTNCAATTTMASGVTCIEGFGNYLFIGNYLVTGTRQRSRIAWNLSQDIATWPAASYMDLDPDDHDEITAMKPVGDYLVVFKKYKIFIVYWVGGTLQFQSARRSVTKGCVGPNAVVEVGGKLIFLGIDGVYSFDGTSVQELSTKIRPLFHNLNPAYVHLSEAYEYLKKKQVWFTVPYNVSGTTTTTKNYVFVWDYELNNWTKYDLSCSAVSNYIYATTTKYSDLNVTYGAETTPFGSYATYGDERTYIGFLAGTINEFGRGTTKDNATAITSMWKSIWVMPGKDGNPDPITNKRLTRISLLLTRKSAGNLLVDLQEDWKDEEIADANQSWSGTQSASLTGTTTANILERRLDATRYGRAFQVVCSGDSSGNPWTLHKIMIDITDRGRTLVS